MSRFVSPDCRCHWGRDEDGRPECMDDDCWCFQHCRDEDSGVMKWEVEQAEHWDGTVPLGGDDMDGK